MARFFARATVVALMLALLVPVPGTAGQQPGDLLPPNDTEISGPFALPTVIPARVKIDMQDLPAAKLTGRTEGSTGTTGPDAPAARPWAPEGSLGIPSLPSLGSQAALAAPVPSHFTAPERNFAGVGGTNRIPPDTVGDVGPDHYIQMTNVGYQIFDKDGNALLLDGGGNPQTTNLSALWTAAGVGTQCANRNDGDPVVVYDHLADRWVLTQFAVPNGATTGPGWLCVAVSQTGDPMAGTWNLYEFQFNNGVDYPKFGLWPDAYLATTQRGFPGSAANPALDAYAFDRAQMLAGGAVTPQQFTLNGPALVILPSDLDGPAPPAGTPAFFARHVDGDQWGGTDRIDLWSLTLDLATPANSTLTALPSLATLAFDSNLCGTGNLMDQCVPQQGTTQLLSTIPHWPMYSLQYRIVGGTPRMVFNHTVDVDGTGHAGVKWYELQQVGGNWTIGDEGLHAPDTGAAGTADDLWRWMGSIAMDRDGNIALGYSTSDDAAFPSIAYAGRHTDDPPGTLPHGEVVLQAGGGVQTPINCTGGPCGHRWGDYSAMRVDPVDDCTFWYTQEFIASTVNGGINWSTQIGAFRFCNDAPTADANGPYTTDEGADVALDGSGSTDPNPTDTLTHEWDLDDNGTFETPGVSPDFTDVGRDGVFDVCLRVTDAGGLTDTDCTTVTVNNVAPSLTGLVQDSPHPEGGRVTISGTVTDPGWEDPLSFSVDWDGGTEVSAVVDVEEHVRPDGTLAFTAMADFGDDGAFTLEVCGQDDDTETCADLGVTFTNVDPDAEIDLSGAVLVNGVPTIIGEAGEPVEFTGRATDPGSDDLDREWDFDDGTVVTLATSWNDPAFMPDPDPSPTLHARDETDVREHTFGDACVYEPSFTAEDDDGGSDVSTAAVLIQGNADRNRPAGWWSSQYDQHGPSFEDAVLLCYLEIARFGSAVFDEEVPLGTIEEGHDVLHGGGDAIVRFDRAALAAWLNFANGSIGFGDIVADTDGDGTPETSFGDAMAAAEAVRLDATSTAEEVEAQRAIVHRISQPAS